MSKNRNIQVSSRFFVSKAKNSSLFYEVCAIFIIIENDNEYIKLMDFSFVIYRSVPSQKMTLAKVDATEGHKYIISTK